jgi:hypothetical protein
MFSARRGQDFRRDHFEPLVTVAHAPSSLPIVFLQTLLTVSLKVYKTVLLNDTDYTASKG